MSARLERAIGGANVATELFGARDDRTPVLNRVASSSPLVLSEFVALIPRHGAQTTALSDALLRQENNPPVRAWIEAARHATLATDIVTSAPGWMSHPERAWQVVGDVADFVEALTVLDGRLALQTVDHVKGWVELNRNLSPRLRLVAGHTAALSRSGPPDPTVDGLARQESSMRPVAVTRFEEIVPGMQAAQRFASRYLMSVDELRSFALVQSDIAADCAHLVTDDRLQALRESFAFREVRFRQLAAATTRAASIGYAGGRPLLAQSLEIGRLIHTARTSQAAVPLGVLADIDAEYPLVTRAVARKIGRAFEDGSYLVPDDDSIALRWRRTKFGETSPILSAAEEAAGTQAELPDLEWSAQRLAAWDRTANQRETDRLAPTPLARARPPYRPLDADDQPSADYARRELRAQLDRQPLDRPHRPNRRPSRTV